MAQAMSGGRSLGSGPTVGDADGEAAAVGGPGVALAATAAAGDDVGAAIDGPGDVAGWLHPPTSARATIQHAIDP
jgi:hypothetical protein